MIVIPSTVIRDELNRRRWVNDPVSWVMERGRSFLWSAQRRIMESVRDFRRTAVQSCHGPGKSFTAAQIVAWWLGVHPAGEAAVVTTAPTDRQVRVILWKEIRRAHTRARLEGRTNQKEWILDIDGKEEIVAFGMKPADYDPAAFQGIHARRVLVILDEACGIPGKTPDRPQSLWEGADSLLANDDCRILAIGNPDDPSAEFAKICRPGSGWNVIRISAFDTPNFTGEVVPEKLRHDLVGRTWVEEKRQALVPTWTWTADGKMCVPPDGARVEDAHPLWLSKVMGMFPENPEESGLIPITWIQAAMDRELNIAEPIELGVDVGAGGDSSTTALRKGPVVRIISEDHNPDTMQTCGKVLAERRATGAALVKVDRIGIGKGLVDRALELREPFVGINVGEPSSKPEEFLNLRAELWWGLRERFEQGDIDLDPRDEATVAELCSVRYSRTSRGQIKIESKENALKRGFRSPNRAEAVMLAFAPPPVGPGGFLAGRATW